LSAKDIYSIINIDEKPIDVGLVKVKQFEVFYDSKY
jgi:hypothetical protein